MNTQNKTNKALDMSVNVHIIVKSANGQIKQQIRKHNKASYNMIEGIVKFLRGEFNNTSLNIDSIGSNAEYAHTYIPSFIGFGDIGVTYGDNNSYTIAYSGDMIPQYSNDGLQREMFKANIVSGSQRNSRLALQRSTSGKDILADTQSLVISSTINYAGDNFNFYRIDGSIVDNMHNENSSNNFIITELGLFSGNVDQYDSKLLARLLLDPQTPLIIDKYSTVIVNWTLGIYSINDAIINQMGSIDNYKYYTQKSAESGITWETI